MRSGIFLFLLAIASSSFGSANATAVEQYRNAMSLLIANDSQADQNDALNQLRLAADQGYAPAQSALGTLYQQGFIVAQDVPTAIAWYKKAADQGDWIAQFSLGRIYFLGGPVPRDTAASRKWFEQAASDPATAERPFSWGFSMTVGRALQPIIGWLRSGIGSQPKEGIHSPWNGSHRCYSKGSLETAAWHPGKKHTFCCLSQPSLVTITPIIRFHPWKPTWEKTALIMPAKKRWICGIAFSVIPKGTATGGKDNTPMSQRLLLWARKSNVSVSERGNSAA